MTLQKHISNVFLKHHIKLDEVKLLLAVSGGKDSMVLLSLLSDMEVNFEVAHMNYQLRDDAANLDQALVENVCKEKNIPCHIKVVDTKAFCKENKVSTQEGARMLRYQWFSSLIDSQEMNYITTAHHESDNHETFIQNLKRGSGLRGLKSMVFLQNGRCKPLLNCARELIDKYAKEFAVPYRQDASNNQNHYLRNLMDRHPQQIKRERQDKKRHEINVAKNSDLKTAIKRVLESSALDKAQVHYTIAVSTIDKMVSKGILKKNTAARRKSQITKHLNTLSA